MPYFKWQGVDIVGKMHKGSGCAPSEKQLEKNLLTQDIALLKSKV